MNLITRKSQYDTVFRHQEQPKLQEGSVVVLDKASYHSRVSGKCLKYHLVINLIVMDT